MQRSGDTEAEKEQRKLEKKGPINKQGFKASLDGNSGKKNYLNINYQKDGSNSVANRNIYLYKYHPESGFEQIKNQSSSTNNIDENIFFLDV